MFQKAVIPEAWVPDTLDHGHLIGLNRGERIFSEAKSVRLFSRKYVVTLGHCGVVKLWKKLQQGIYHMQNIVLKVILERVV